MAFNIVWSVDALDDLQRLHDFLAPASEQAAAQRTVDLVDYVDHIAANAGLTVALPQFAPDDVRRGLVSGCEVRFLFDRATNHMHVLRIFHQREHR